MYYLVKHAISVVDPCACCNLLGCIVGDNDSFALLPVSAALIRISAESS